MRSLGITSSTSVYLIVGLILLIVLGLIVALMIFKGNVPFLRFLHKMGLPLLSGNIRKDYTLLKSLNSDVVGWLRIPSTCYSPIMSAEDSFYRSHDYKKGSNSSGELYITRNLGHRDLSSVSNQSSVEDAFFDLAVVNGSSGVRANTIREAKFSFLNKYILSELKHLHPDIDILFKGKVRTFNLLFAVELQIENRQGFMFTDRRSFISGLRKNAFVDTGRETNNSIVILNASTGLDTLLVFLVEKED